MIRDKELNSIVRQFGELAHELEEALNAGAEINHELYQLERKIVSLSCELSDERSNRAWLSQALEEGNGVYKP